MLNSALTRLGLLNEQIRPAPPYTRYLKRLEDSTTVDYDSELKGSLNVKQFYKGKTILITGCTGFLAKVILEKILRSCPDVGKIYLMVRPKQKMDPMKRIEMEILTSQVFSRLISMMGQQEFMQFAFSKIVPI